MDECKDCEKAPSHISKCFSETGYCKYFPYEMPGCFGKRENLKDNKSKETKRERNKGDDAKCTLMGNRLLYSIAPFRGK